MIIKNAKIYTSRHTFEEGDLFIRDGRIVPFAQPEEGEEVVDASESLHPVFLCNCSVWLQLHFYSVRKAQICGFP